MGGPCLVYINFGKCKDGLELIDRVLQFCVVFPWACTRAILFHNVNVMCRTVGRT